MLVRQNRDVTDDSLQPLSLPGQPLGPDGLRIGVLVCHGFTGSPASMRPWGEHLAAAGFAVELPRLPGHGTTWEEMEGTRWPDWYAEAKRAFAILREQNDLVFLAGLSMGGTLSLRLAADHPGEVAGLLLVNPAVRSDNKQLLALPLLKWVLRKMPGIGNDIKLSGADERGYDVTPLKPLASMVGAWKELRPALPTITTPLRLFRSTEDHVVDPSSAALIMATVGSSDKREILLENSYHVATIDHDAPLIFAESVAFIRSVAHLPD